MRLPNNLMIINVYKVMHVKFVRTNKKVLQ